MRKLKEFSQPSAVTIKKAAVRAFYAGIFGALGAYVIIPVNMENPKQYLSIVAIGMIGGFLEGLRKFVSGYLKYDLK